MVDGMPLGAEVGRNDGWPLGLVEGVPTGNLDGVALV